VDLLEEFYFWVALLGELFQLPVIVSDPLGHRFHALQ
jgi:hypothetical protein